MFFAASIAFPGYFIDVTFIFDPENVIRVDCEISLLIVVGPKCDAMKANSAGTPLPDSLCSGDVYR